MTAVRGEKALLSAATAAQSRFPYNADPAKDNGEAGKEKLCAASLK
ncbi:MAG: hypothetical protein IJT77_12720 [Clostridia bacterium]|nr:hypothetical protein [Clostridia bacterium]